MANKPYTGKITEQDLMDAINSLKPQSYYPEVYVSPEMKAEIDKAAYEQINRIWGDIDNSEAQSAKGVWLDGKSVAKSLKRLLKKLTGNGK